MAKHDDLTVPIYSSLEPVYGEGSQLEEAQLRFNNLKSKFLEVFGHPADVYARSPGRVNLIGEHIDYEGYSVLPMAIRQDTIVAIRKRDSGENGKLLRIANVNDKYAMCIYPSDPDQEVDLKNHQWGHYFICAYKGFHEYAKAKWVNAGPTIGLDILVDGTVPTGSGLPALQHLFALLPLPLWLLLMWNSQRKNLHSLHVNVKDILEHSPVGWTRQSLSWPNLGLLS